MATSRSKTKAGRKNSSIKSTPRVQPTAWVKVPAESEAPEDVQVLFGKFKEKTGFIPNVARNFALTPEHFMRWFRYYDFLMRNEEKSQLSRKEREMIAVVVSSANECEYCLASHSAYLREITGDPVLPDVLAANFRRAHLTPREHALLEFAHQITLDSAVMSSADVQMLRAIGLSDEAIFEAAQVAAMFNFTNRIANSMGWVPNEVYYHQHRSKK
ncbi:MAG: peroxidase-related enzyme [Meiothermus sp.]|nr:peroxidase-related enzyme [Meiothermus sp.]